MPRGRSRGSATSVISHGRSAQIPESGPNLSILEHLVELQAQATNNENIHWCYSRAIKSLTSYKEKITSYDSAINVPYIGKMIATKISVFLKNNPEVLSEGLEEVGFEFGGGGYVLGGDEVGGIGGARIRGRGMRRVDGFGGGLGEEVLDTVDGGDEVGLPKKKKRKKRSASKVYRPKHRSGGYAILIVLFKAEQRGELFMRKADLVKEAQPYADEPMLAEMGGLFAGGSHQVSANKSRYYSAWSSMKTLVSKALVARGGNPTKFSLSGTGKVLASDLWAQNISAESRMVTHYTPEGRCENDEFGGVSEWGEVWPKGEGDELGGVARRQETAKTRTMKKKRTTRPRATVTPTKSPEPSPPRLGGAGAQDQDEMKVHVRIIEKVVELGYDVMAASKTLEMILAIAKGRQRREAVLQKTLLDILRRKRHADQDTRSPDHNVTAKSARGAHDVIANEEDIVPTQKKDISMDITIGKSPTIVKRDKVENPPLLFSQQSNGDSECIRLVDDDTGIFPKYDNPVKLQEPQQDSDDEVMILDEITPTPTKKPIEMKPRAMHEPEVVSRGDVVTCQIILLVDNREIFGGGFYSKEAFFQVIQEQARLRGVRVESRVLPVGDALCIAKVMSTGEEFVLDYVIERKTLDDYRSSVADGRFENQVYAMKNCGISNPVYLVEGRLEKFFQPASVGNDEQMIRNSGLSEAGLRKKLVELSVNDGLFVNYVRNMMETAGFYLSLARRLSEKYGRASVGELREKRKEFDEWVAGCDDLSSKKKLTVGQLFELQLTCVPRLGATTVDRITGCNIRTFADLWDAYKKCSNETEKEELLSSRVSEKSGRAPAALSKKVYQLVNFATYPTMPAAGPT